MVAWVTIAGAEGGEEGGNKRLLGPVEHDAEFAFPFLAKRSAERLEYEGTVGTRTAAGKEAVIRGN